MRTTIGDTKKTIIRGAIINKGALNGSTAVRRNKSIVSTIKLKIKPIPTFPLTSLYIGVLTSLTSSISFLRFFFELLY